MVDLLVTILVVGVVITILCVVGASSDVPPPPPAPPQPRPATLRPSQPRKRPVNRPPPTPGKASSDTPPAAPAPTMMAAPSSSEPSQWPRRRQYEAAAARAESFEDEELQTSNLRTQKDGRPLVASGSKAVVFIMDAPGRAIALRCFLNKPDDGSGRRYKAL